MSAGVDDIIGRHISEASRNGEQHACEMILIALSAVSYPPTMPPDVVLTKVRALVVEMRDTRTINMTKALA